MSVVGLYTYEPLVEFRFRVCDKNPKNFDTSAEIRGRVIVEITLRARRRIFFSTGFLFALTLSLFLSRHILRLCARMCHICYISGIPPCLHSPGYGSRSFRVCRSRVFASTGNYVLSSLRPFAACFAISLRLIGFLQRSPLVICDASPGLQGFITCLDRPGLRAAQNRKPWELLTSTFFLEPSMIIPLFVFRSDPRQSLTHVGTFKQEVDEESTDLMEFLTERVRDYIMSRQEFPLSREDVDDIDFVLKRN